MNPYRCSVCAAEVSTKAHDAFFNHLHAEFGRIRADKFSRLGLCPICFQIAQLRLDVTALCANFTGLHTRINKLEGRLK